jgi:Tfp pilus assembly protein PilX
VIRRLIRALRRTHEDERGVVLANVLIFGTVMMLLVATMIAVSTSGAVKSAADRNFQNAMAAAYAGLADYQAKLSNDNGYALYGNANAQFSKATGSSFTGNDSNIAFTNTGSQWAPVVGSSDQSFRYEVDNSDYSAKGVLRVRVTGKSGASVRSLVANLKGDGFINYLYFTNYESSNPALTGSSCTTAYQWQTGVSGKCSPVQFAGSDVLNGPIRTNDVFTAACSTTFTGSVEQHDATVRSSGGGCSGVFKGGAPSIVPYLGLPALNSNMSQETRTDIPATVPRPGCLYTGPTRVSFLGNGNMTVWSPWSKATQVKVSSSTGEVVKSDDIAKAASLCGTIDALQSAAGATIPTLPANLMYVQDIPSAANNVNTWPSGTIPSKYSNTYCSTAVTVQGGKVSTKSNQPYSNGQGFPAANEWINTGSANNYRTGSVSDTYSCTAGDLFVSGGFSGAMTMVASGTIWVTGDITYGDPTNDILGLVGQNAVEIYNPAQCSAYPTSFGTVDYSRCTSGGVGLLNRGYGAKITISAAIASNAGTFWNQNYDIGSQLGVLKVIGSIAQNWRGAVATTGGTGFVKNYVYDQRLLTTAPPKFLQPVSTSYGVTTQVEVQSAYKTDGSCATTTTGVCR